MRLLAFALLTILIGIGSAQAQIDFPPPQGKGRVVVVMSGHSGPGHYQAVAGLIAQLGYDVALFDANSIAGNVAAGLRTAIGEALQSPHALPGKVGLVGFSQGGGQVLRYGSQMPDLVAVVAAWYPETRFLGDAADFVADVQVAGVGLRRRGGHLPQLLHDRSGAGAPRRRRQPHRGCHLSPCRARFRLWRVALRPGRA